MNDLISARFSLERGLEYWKRKQLHPEENPNYLYVTDEYFEKVKGLFDLNTNDEGENFYTYEEIEVRPGWESEEHLQFQFGF